MDFTFCFYKLLPKCIQWTNLYKSIIRVLDVDQPQNIKIFIHVFTVVVVIVW